jgi:DNA-directed RNA polymerase subunit RPC12/RpoP
MSKCSICEKEFDETTLTEIGLGTENYQCENCWNEFGEPIND